MHQQQEDPFIFDLGKDFEEDNNDLISIQLSSQLIQIYYIQICKYSQLIQDKFSKSEAMTQIPQYVLEIQKKYNISDDNIITFFKLLQEEKIEIRSSQYCDLCKLTTLFQVHILRKSLKKYARKYSKNIEFIINLMIEHYTKSCDDIFTKDDFSEEMEDCLKNSINQCLQNQNFKKLPPSVVYRIIKRSEKEKIQMDLLYKFIIDSIETHFVLFSFIEIMKLSDNNFNDLYNKYLNAKGTEKEFVFEYLGVDLILIKNLKENNNSLKEENKSFREKIEKFENDENQNWNLEYDLMNLKKEIDFKCLIKIINELLSKIKFENKDEKSNFCHRNILGIAEKSGTNDLINFLALQKLITINPKNISCFFFNKANYVILNT